MSDRLDLPCGCKTVGALGHETTPEKQAERQAAICAHPCHWAYRFIWNLT